VQFPTGHPSGETLQFGASKTSKFGFVENNARQCPLYVRFMQRSYASSVNFLFVIIPPISFKEPSCAPIAFTTREMDIAKA
jgi:hypothetical protein